MTKFNKSRIIPLHPTVTEKLRQYSRIRAFQRNIKTNSLFITKRGLRVSKSTVNIAFAKASEQEKIREVGASSGPRLHDLRHTFAVNALIKWLRTEPEVDCKVPALSTYLGHSNPKATHWYFSIVPRLMDLARARMEKAAEDIQ